MGRDLLEGSEKYRRRAFAGSRRFLAELANEGQSPSTLFVGCCDSRVVPELLTSSHPGDLFVVRNVANVVPSLNHADASVGAAIEYAVGHLRVAHAVVCGHTRCGGVQAALDGLQDSHLPSLTEWISLVRVGAVPPHLVGDARWDAAVEANVLAQREALLTYPCVSDAVAAGQLQLHAWVYDLQRLDLRVFDDEEDAFRLARDLV